MNLDNQDVRLSSDSAEEPLWAEIDHALARLQEASGAFDQATADALGLNRSDLQCLVFALGRGPMTAGELGAACSLTTGSVTALLDRMERSGYLRRSADRKDRRRVLAEATPMAAERMRGLVAPLAEATRSRLAGVSAENLGAIRDFLRAGADVREQQAAIMRARLSGTGAPNELSAPLNEVRAGRLVFETGVTRVRLGADRDMLDLYRVHFDGTAPQVECHDGVVAIRYRRSSLLAFRKHQAADMILNSSIPWSIEVRGGTSQVIADLSDVRLESLTVTGGASQVNLTLGRPTDTVPVRISGGASDFTVLRPRGTPMRLRVRGSMSWAIVDGASRAPSNSSGWLDYPGDAGSGRYDIEVSGGASMLRVDAY